MPKKLKIAGILAATGLAAALIGIKFKSGKPIFAPAYTVLRVIDGDTFETTEKQLIRVASIEAPETGLCGSDEAKAELEKLILNKPVYLKVLFRDPYYRLVSQVYSPDGYINQIMLENGYAYYYNRANLKGKELQVASDHAHAEKLGLFRYPCTQAENKDQPKCNIKGNVRNSTKLYFTPSCRQYEKTTIQLYLGDQWFCTEAAAQKAGFTKGKQC